MFIYRKSYFSDRSSRSQLTKGNLFIERPEETGGRITILQPILYNLSSPVKVSKTRFRDNYSLKTEVMLSIYKKKEWYKVIFKRGGKRRVLLPGLCLHLVIKYFFPFISLNLGTLV